MLPSAYNDPLGITRVSLQIAKRQGVVNPENTFYSVKRFIGRRMDEVDAESKARHADHSCHAAQCGPQ